MSFVEEETLQSDVALMAPEAEAPSPVAPSQRPRRALVSALATSALVGCALAWAGCWRARAAGGAADSLLATTQSRAFSALDEVHTVLFPVVLRDFPGNLPEKKIEMFGDNCEASKHMVKDHVGTDGKPAWSGKEGEGNIRRKEEFHALWNTVEGVNKEYPQALKFTKSPSGSYTINAVEFFPLDDYKKDTEEHNFFFSLEMRTHFTYQGGEKFYFRGDDDVFLFINGTLVVNLGGCHNPEVAEVDVDKLGLTAGQDYPFDFFFAERRCCGSSLRIDTTLQLIHPAVEEEKYQCCFFHFVKLPWICFDSKKFPWCAAEE